MSPKSFSPFVALLTVLAALPARVAHAADSLSSSEELVRQARAHEATHDDDLAVRRYMEALAIDATTQSAWLGLGALRLRLGDPIEAERVYSSALEHVPTLHSALQARAHVRWGLGRRAEAESDLDAFATMDDDAQGLQQLAEWYAAEGRTPAQLAVWRRLLAKGIQAEDEALTREARRMVRALIVLVDTADPVASPVDPDPTRKALARIAKRGG